jgi:hypothetical protein
VSLTFIMEVTCYSERSVDFQRPIQRYLRQNRASSLVSFGLRAYIVSKFRYINYSVIELIFPSHFLQSV